MSRIHRRLQFLSLGQLKIEKWISLSNCPSISSHLQKSSRISYCEGWNCDSYLVKLGAGVEQSSCPASLSVFPPISRFLDERRRRQGSCSPLCEQWRSLMLLCSKISKFLGIMLFYWWIRCSDAGYSAPNPIWVAYLIWNQIYPFLTEVANNLPLCLELRTFGTTSLLFVWCKLEAKHQIPFNRRVFNFRIGSVIWLL